MCCGGLYSENAEISMICTVVWPSHTGSAVIVHRPSDRPRKRHLGLLDNYKYALFSHSDD